MIHKVLTENSVKFLEKYINNSSPTGFTIALSRRGISSSLISPPLRYMHTLVEIVHISDVENSILLILETHKNSTLQK